MTHRPTRRCARWSVANYPVTRATLISPAGEKPGCRLAARRRRGVLVQRRDEGSHLRCNRSRRMRHRFGEGVHQRPETTCGGCLPTVKQLLADSGVVMSKALCEHFAQSRAELFQIVQSTQTRTFSALIAKYGKGARLRHLQARSRFDSGIDGLRSHPAPPAGVVAGHQRSLPREHPEERYVLRGTSDAGRRGHG